MNSNIQSECQKRGIRRVCHFTQSRNMAHIFGDDFGIRPTQILKELNLPHNPTDPNRFDGRDDLISCSIEYPNAYYFNVAKNKEPLFEDWVVLLMEPSLIWQTGALYCPCNAAKLSGSHIGNNFLSLFQAVSIGNNISRTPKHLPSSPTDLQSELLVPGNIPLAKIYAIAVESEEQAKKELLRMRLQGVSFDKEIYIVPDFFSNASVLATMIQRGSRVQGKPYFYENNRGGSNVQ